MTGVVSSQMKRLVALYFLVISMHCAVGQTNGDWVYLVTQSGRPPNSVYSVTIKEYIGPGGVVTIPEIIDGKPVRTIGNKMQSIDPTSKLVGVVIPGSVTNIANYAFWKLTNLVDVTIGSSVQSIGFGAFGHAGNLTNIVIPDSVTTFGTYGFYMATNLTNVVLGAGLTNIGLAEFSDCPNLRQIVIPSGVKSIGKYAFNFGAGLTNVVIGQGVTNIGEFAFHSCSNLPTVTVPGNVKSIGMGAFSESTSLTNVVLDEGITSIGSSAFAFCDSLMTATIPESVTNIPASLFDTCANLASVVIGSNVATIGDYAFADCPQLATVLFLGSPPVLSGSTYDLFSTNSAAADISRLPDSQGWSGSFAGRSTWIFAPVSGQAGFSDGQFGFSWSGTGSVPMSVQRSMSLGDGPWDTIGSGITNGLFVDPTTPAGSASYRAVFH